MSLQEASGEEEEILSEMGVSVSVIGVFTFG